MFVSELNLNSTPKCSVLYLQGASCMYSRTAPVPRTCMCHVAGQQPMQGQYLTEPSPSPYTHPVHPQANRHEQQVNLAHTSHTTVANLLRGNCHWQGWVQGTEMMDKLLNNLLPLTAVEKYRLVHVQRDSTSCRSSLG